MSQRRPLSPPISPSPRDVHFTSMNDNDAAKQRREVLGLLNSLRSLGLTQTLDLPTIAVIGSQSAGKSSLIEALCKIKLPRSAGTCTRCPIECQSQYADTPWTAEVFLKFERTDRGSGADVGGEVPFGGPLEDPNQVEDRIRRAQIAVLNPAVDPDVILGGEEPTGGLSFTKNCVVVKLSGRELADLSFVDLPGIIVSTSDEKNKGDIKLVQKLISSYMSKASTINLIVLTCETDYETQAAGLLAKKYDPTGERTIGVLTKPDRIEQGQESQWIPLITGQQNPLLNGWFTTKQLSTRDREAGLAWEQARAQESEFFDTEPGWSKVPERYRDNLGSKNLAMKLGEVLSKEIRKRLPAIRLEVDRLTRANDFELSKLPDDHPDGPRELVMQLLGQLLQDIKKQVIDGDPCAGEKGIVQQIRVKHVEMSEQMQEAQPVFLPRGHQGAELPTPEFLPSDETWLSRSAVGNEYDVDKVIYDAEWARTREWPGHFPFEIIRMYMHQVVEVWKGPIEATFSSTQDLYESKVIELINNHFALYSCGGLHDQVNGTAMELLAKCKKDSNKALKELLDQEWHPESAHERQYLEYEDKFADYYRDFFESAKGWKTIAKLIKAGANQELASAIGVLQKLGLPALGVEDWDNMQTLNKPDAGALRIISSVRAHYEIAYRRFVDKVKDTADQRFVRAFGKEIENMLMKNLGLTTDTPESHYAELTRESDDILAYKVELKEKADRLRAARIKLAL
ncbi:unnamed protein product [Rhizoctonia solani]|uniref:Interferon-induced GTP-binding protein Mx n=1 Tax=Rhizoctonia solani TaxID=456999 RepID=A0A8H3AQ21_9AGAM|nr:unnamed protein product [Rhizoctonia solani]